MQGQIAKKSSWTKEQKKLYLSFISRYLPTINDEYPKNFYRKMSKALSGSKTTSQCQDFHGNKKRGTSTVEQIITNVALKIGLNPSDYLKSAEDIEKLKNEKISYFKSLQNSKSIDEVVFEKFMNELNPFEAIFKPNQIPPNQQKQHQGQKQTHQIWNPQYLRPVEKKLLSAKDEEMDLQIHSSNSEDDESDVKQMASQRQASEEEQKTSTKRWTDQKCLKYLVFLMKYKKSIPSQNKWKSQGIFTKMSKFMKLKGDSVISSAHWEFAKNKQGLDKLIKYLQLHIDCNKTQIYYQIKKINEFYNQDLKKQMYGLTNVKLRLFNFGNNYHQQIMKIISTQQNQGNRNFNNNQVENMEFTLLVIIDVVIQKISKIMMKKQQNNQMEDENENENENETNFKKNNEKGKVKKTTRISQRNNLERHEEMYFQKGYLQSIANLKKQTNRWSVYQNMKFAMYLLINRDAFASTDKCVKNGIFTKLCSFINTDKSIKQCTDHFDNLNYHVNKDLQTSIDDEIKYYGLKPSMVEERKRICMEVKSEYSKIGNFVLQIDHFPFEKMVQQQKISEQQISREILDAKPFLSFYLIQQNQLLKEKILSIQDKSEIKEKNPLNSNEKTQFALRTSVRLQVSQQKFESMKQKMKLQPSEKISNVKVMPGDKISIQIPIKQVYRFIFQKKQNETQL